MKYLAVLVTLLGTASSGLAAGIINGGFEAGLTGWSTIGAVTPLGIIGAIVPTQGAFQAEVSSGESKDQPILFSENTLGVAAGSFAAAFPALSVPVAASAVYQNFTANAGDVLKFDWNFTTDEPDPGAYDGGFFSLSFGGTGSVFRLADTNVGGGIVLDTTTGQIGAIHGMTGYHTATFILTSTGTYRVGFGSLQTSDDANSSNLYVDNVLGGSDQVVTGPAPEPGTLVSMFGAAAALLVVRRRKT